jgi:hypothetical protein
MIQTPTEKKICECERKLKKMKPCKGCGKEHQPDEECTGLCESCRRFYLQTCGKEFGIEI